ncbi:uncharacterized protein FIBRA_06842 [Fibroporia radiculosa]|uniref:Uncharacterized protein n=1 Tax=Fibroporia radiculosa TaxID=599839 RepID=J4GCN5_9APHY|nr:uncharacterized protein FIBRA_06842 [Fibroporia radiculosa]CCM04658.1 predicted protein [Fibroporia radiculosa]
MSFTLMPPRHLSSNGAGRQEQAIALLVRCGRMDGRVAA